MLRTLARIVGSFALLAIGAISVLVNWANLTSPGDPDAVLAVWGNNAGALIQKADNLDQSTATASARLKTIGQHIHRAFPLSEAPLVYAAREASEKDRTSAALQMYQAALFRQPRNVPALTNLAAAAIAEGEYETAIVSLHKLKILNPSGEPAYAATMADIANAPGGDQAFDSALQRGSPLANQALRQLNAESKDYKRLLRFNRHAPETAGPLINRLLKDQGPEAAFIAWLSLLPSSETRGFAWPYDPAFVGSSAPPPFSWAVSREAEMLKQGGLYASVSGSGAKRTAFARQTILLGAGTYEFHAEMDGEIGVDGAHFEWTLECLNSKEQIGRLKVTDLEPIVVRRQLMKFEVPETGCAAQELIFFGVPGLYPVRARATVRKTMISKFLDIQ